MVISPRQDTSPWVIAFLCSDFYAELKTFNFPAMIVIAVVYFIDGRNAMKFSCIPTAVSSPAPAPRLKYAIKLPVLHQRGNCGALQSLRTLFPRRLMQNFPLFERRRRFTWGVVWLFHIAGSYSGRSWLFRPLPRGASSKGTWLYSSRVALHIIGSTRVVTRIV